MTPPSNAGLTPEIDAFRREFERLADLADALVAPLSDQQFVWQPTPSSWSVALCIDHLNTTARAYLPVLDEGISDAIRRGLYQQGPFRYSLVGRLIVAANQPRSILKYKAPKPFQPPTGRTRREIMSAFRAYQVQFVDRLRQSNGLDLAEAWVRSPVIGWLRMPLGCGFAAMTAHERRHRPRNDPRR